jgi:PAS domain S-box-containing protein
MSWRMMPLRDDPYAAETARDVGRRAPAGIWFFFGCILLGAVFDIARFPERTPWMLGFAAAFVALGGTCLLLLRARPAASVPVLIGFVNLVGVGLNAYHAIVAAPVAMCLWTLTGLLCSAAVFLRWGATNQAFAAIGSVALFPLHALLGNVDGLTWAAGGTYLLVMVAMSVFGAGLYADYVRSGLQLARTLSEREARLQSYFDLAPVGCAVLHPDGRFLEVNDALAAILGSTQEALFAANWFDLPVARDRDAVRAHAAAALASPGESSRRDARFVRGDGIEIDATVDVRGLPGPRGAIDHLMVLVQDVTARKRADAERERVLSSELHARRLAEDASRAKDEFLATLSHELRTPLSPIMTWADLLRRRRIAPADAERGLGAIARNATALSRLIDERLDVSRIESGKLRLELHPVEIGPVVLEAIEVVRPAAEAKGVAVEAEVEPDGCRVLADSDRLRQVLWNLLANAVKFTPREGRVRVTLAHGSRDARIVVEDTGQGIDPAFLPFVFERFRQGDTTSTRRHGGLGIGLAIVREMVELHGGRVHVESRGEGLGSRFTVTLPLLDDDQPVDQSGLPRSNVATLDGVRVLVVDDDPDSNDAVRTVLVAYGADVRTADSADEALEVLERWTPDVIVSDIAMPGEDGYALLARMRSGAAAMRAIPTIALTAYSSSRDRDQALSAGFHAHVSKPLRPPDLLHAVVVAREARYRGLC